MPGPIAGAVATIGSSVIGASSANKAAKAQEDAANRDIALKQDIFNQQKQMFQPYRAAGGNALAAYNFEMGLGARPAGYGGFKKTPGYDFRLNEGLDGVQAGVGARHGLNSGATMKALNRYGQDYASNEYGTHMNRLGGLMQQGQASAAMTATAGNNYSQGTGNALANIGNANAAGAIGVGNAIQGGINNGIGAWMYGKGQGLWGNA